jgi:hypothetical protein
LYDIRTADRGFANNRDLGFNHIHVTPEKTEVQFISADGECLHAFRRTPDGQVEVIA